MSYNYFGQWAVRESDVSHFSAKATVTKEASCLGGNQASFILTKEPFFHVHETLNPAKSNSNPLPPGSLPSPCQTPRTISNKLMHVLLLHCG